MLCSVCNCASNLHVYIVHHYRSGIEESFGLFVEALLDSTSIQRLIDYGQEVSHWVAGEIVACSNPKVATSRFYEIIVLFQFLD